MKTVVTRVRFVDTSCAPPLTMVAGPPPDLPARRREFLRERWSSRTGPLRRSTRSRCNSNRPPRPARTVSVSTTATPSSETGPTCLDAVRWRNVGGRKAAKKPNTFVEKRYETAAEHFTGLHRKHNVLVPAPLPTTGGTRFRTGRESTRTTFKVFDSVTRAKFNVLQGCCRKTWNHNTS